MPYGFIAEASFFQIPVGMQTFFGVQQLIKMCCRNFMNFKQPFF